MPFDFAEKFVAPPIFRAVTRSTRKTPTRNAALVSSAVAEGSHAPPAAALERDFDEVFVEPQLLESDVRADHDDVDDEAPHADDPPPLETHTAASPRGDFDALFARWQASGDPAQRDQLILMYRNLVVSLARRFLDRGEMFEDIVQQGMIGLIYALDHFDASRNVRFTTFATPSILGEIRRYFRDKSWGIRVPRRMQELNQIINRRIEQLAQQYDRAPTYAEIANALNVPVEDVIEVLEMAHTIEPMSLDEQGASGEGSVLASLGDTIGAADPNLQRWTDFAPLQAALESLPERQRIVVKAIYFQGRSQTEIALELNVSQMYVSRAQRRALAKLKEILREGDL